MISVFDLFKIGIGPSSSHTVGPMIAANRFVSDLQDNLSTVTQMDIELFGSLAATGKGHATDTAVLLGLLGHTPSNIDTRRSPQYLAPIFEQQTLTLSPTLDTSTEKSISTADHISHTIPFDYHTHLHWHDDTALPYHPNALTLIATLQDGSRLQKTYYSVGGGFVVSQDEIEEASQSSLDTSSSTNKDSTNTHTGNEKTENNNQSNRPKNEQSNKQTNEQNTHIPLQDSLPSTPYPFTTAAELLTQCQTHGLSVAELMMTNELAYRSQEDVLKHLDDVWAVMQACVKQGCKEDGILPGGLDVKRRAKALYQQLCDEYQQPASQVDSLVAMDWVDLYALAVNEENANGGKVVTAPTNGAAGIIPAVLHYYRDFNNTYSQQGVQEFLLTATAIGGLIKQNASISGAEVGCQGEVGSACAMAAAGLAHVLGASPAQCLNAAEIGIEHNLGLTCDPIEGLVQVPCIERNAMAAVKAINAARLACRGNGEHCVSLDKVIQTMKETGADMSDKYKETARGGLAIYANTAQQEKEKRIPMAALGITVNYSQC